LVCPAQLKGRIKHYAMRDAMDIEGLGEALIEQLVERRIVRDLSDIYHLDFKKVEEVERMKTVLIIKGTHCASCKALIEDVCRELPGVTGCTVEVTWDPPWGPDKMTDAARLQLNMM